MNTYHVCRELGPTRSPKTGRGVGPGPTWKSSLGGSPLRPRSPYTCSGSALGRCAGGGGVIDSDSDGSPLGRLPAVGLPGGLA